MLSRFFKNWSGFGVTPQGFLLLKEHFEWVRVCHPEENVAVADRFRKAKMLDHDAVALSDLQSKQPECRLAAKQIF